jgi:ketosteroid isomerase-like protein
MAAMRPPIATAVSFVDCINRGDVDGLAALMTADHTLTVFAEAPLAGRDANVEGWRSYASSFPHYVIAPHRLSERADVVAIVGHTTGSHLGLPDDDERALTLIWLARVRDGLVAEWTLIEDTPDNRRQHGLTDVE